MDAQAIKAVPTSMHTQRNMDALGLSYRRTGWFVSSLITFSLAGMLPLPLVAETVPMISSWSNAYTTYDIYVGAWGGVGCAGVIAATAEFPTKAEALAAGSSLRAEDPGCGGCPDFATYSKAGNNPVCLETWTHCMYYGERISACLAPQVHYYGGGIQKKCPIPAVRPEVPYTPDPNGLTCSRQDTLTITLSGGTSVEPWHKKFDADHKKTNLPYTATVRDDSGQPAPNIEVTISTDVTQDSGGHVHIEGRHKGKLAIPTDSIKDGKDTITGFTDSNGVYSFVFGSEEASGTHTLTAKCSTGCQAPATATVKVEIQGLSLLDGNPSSYNLNGETSTHPGSHYFSAAAMTKIINLAFKFSHDSLFNKQLLIINDSSLIKGGVLDLGLDWAYTPNGHKGHRVGVVVDINNFGSKNQDFEDFVQRCCEITAKWEGPDVTATPHYHLWLLGKDQ